MAKCKQVFGGLKMNLKQANEILGDRATWELRNMKKALEMLPMLNSDEENERLEAVKTVLKSGGKK